MERVFANTKEKHTMPYPQYRRSAPGGKVDKAKICCHEPQTLVKWHRKGKCSSLIFIFLLNLCTRNPVLLDT